MKPIEQFLNLCSINWRLKGQLPSQALFILNRNTREGGERGGTPLDSYYTYLPSEVPAL